VAKFFSPPHTGASPSISSSCTLRPAQALTPPCFVLAQAAQPRSTPCPCWQESEGRNPLQLQSRLESQLPGAQRGHRSLGEGCGGGYQAASTTCMATGMNQVERLLSQTAVVQPDLLPSSGLQDLVSEHF